MSLRTITAPGVEIVEIDKSDYTRSMVGTAVLVTGFAAKGEDYEPQTITTTMSFVNYFGEPTNEAERYFYAACKEVLAQGGKLIACKLPYDNAATNKFAHITYELQPGTKIASKDDVLAKFENIELSASNSFQEAARTYALTNYKLNFEEKSEIANAATSDVLTIATYITSDDISGGTKNQSSINELIGFAKEVNPEFELTDLSAKLYPIAEKDPSVSCVQTLSESDPSDNMTLAALDLLVTGESRVTEGQIKLIDRLRGEYGKASTKNDDGTLKECIGIIPVMTTAANALYVQGLLDEGKNIVGAFEAIKGAKTISSDKCFEIDSTDTNTPFVQQEDGNVDTVSRLVAKYFPTIGFKDDSTIDTEHLRKVGIVVLRAFVDPAVNNLINFDVLESFAGELDRNAKDPVTGATTFIDNIVNANSEYIYCFSNCNVDKETTILNVNNQTAGDLGFFADMLKKDISNKVSIDDGLRIIFSKNSDIHEKDIDIVLDAGVSNIGQFIKDVYPSGKGVYNPTGENSNLFKLKTSEDNKRWKEIILKYDTFCRLTRHDCMFICDGLRPFCLQGKKKIVRPSKPTNTIDTSILPNIKFLTGLNTNFGAGYCDWFEEADDFSGDSFWCPPSIQACGCYIYTDKTYNIWDAPAGLKRGVITAVDCAFSPSIQQAGTIYEKGWNYAIDYADVGLILEGQKTLQQKASAFDRVNVRRLFLRLERQVYNVARTFVYEANTAYNRQRFVDLLDPIFSTVKSAGGCYDYKIVCDESINTPEVIDNNEFRIKIGVQPTKTAEFILVQFVNCKTGSHWEELENI